MNSVLYWKPVKLFEDGSDVFSRAGMYLYTVYTGLCTAIANSFLLKLISFSHAAMPRREGRDSLTLAKT